MEVKANKIARSFILAAAFMTGAFMNLALAGPVNVNTANAETLAKELVGVGEKTAQAIVAYREANGPFESVDELKAVKGVGDRTIEKNKDNILLSD